MVNGDGHKKGLEEDGSDDDYDDDGHVEVAHHSCTHSARYHASGADPPSRSETTSLVRYRGE